MRDRFTYHQGDVGVVPVDAATADELLEELVLDDAPADVQRRVLETYASEVEIPPHIAAELRARGLLPWSSSC